jgi:hypothetical protein
MKIATMEWHASQCACGHVTLRLGSVQLEFSRAKFAELHKLVGEAMHEFDIPPSERPLVRLDDTTRH